MASKLTRLSKNLFATTQDRHHRPPVLGVRGGSVASDFLDFAAPSRCVIVVDFILTFGSYFAYPLLANFSMLCTRQ
jgi:hypothetical protein